MHLDSRSLIEPFGPIMTATLRRPINTPEVVHDVSTTHNQHSTVHEWGQARSEIHVKINRLVRID